MEKMRLIVVIFYVIATFLDSSAFANESINKEVELYNILKNVKTNKSSLSQDKLDEIARKMTINYKTMDSPILKNTLIKFYSLNRHDTENVLGKIRDLNSNFKSNKYSSQYSSLNDYEHLIQSQTRKLNDISMEKYGVPFHVAAIRGYDISPDGNKLFDFPFTTDGVITDGFPVESFPRYIGTAAPWRLKLGWNWSTVIRYEDGVFGYQQCGFRGTIRNWISYKPAIIAMIYSNGYGGGRLAANSDCFFHKWWTLLAFGYTPIHVSSLLWARVY